MKIISLLNWRFQFGSRWNKQVVGALIISSETADIVENREELSRKVFMLGRWG